MQNTHKRGLRELDGTVDPRTISTVYGDGRIETDLVMMTHQIYRHK